MDVESRETLILAHIPSIKYHAYRIISQSQSRLELGDLINAGVLGLMDAIERFDPSRGVKFRTFADWRIRGAMLDSLRALDWMPSGLRRKGKELQAATDKLHQGDAEIGQEEICGELGITLEALHELTQELHKNIGSFASGANGEDLIEYYPDSDANGPHYQFERQELRTVLAQAIQGLGRKEKVVVSLYYYEELTMKEIGLVLGINESRVSQIHSKAMTELRGKLKHYRTPVKAR
ncbi:MAG: FliA/WhiG family RNA polymerase sigma factor [Acidobacteria bacterium]|nr:MAG: FliA/WhiG family RNA polymerase sigma factor [Acidobacteriota bacterium]